MVIHGHDLGMSYRLSEAPGDFPGDAHTRLYTVSPVAERFCARTMRSALVSLVVLCNALTNRPPGTARRYGYSSGNADAVCCIGARLKWVSA